MKGVSEREWTRLKYPLGLVPVLSKSEVMCVSADRAGVFTWVAAPRFTGKAVIHLAVMHCNPLSGHCPNTGVVCGRREEG